MNVGQQTYPPVKLAARQPVTRKDEVRLRQACADFEGILLTQMLRAMRNTLPRSGILPASVSTQVWESHFDATIGKVLGASGRLGIADLLYREIAGRIQGTGDWGPERHINDRQQQTTAENDDNGGRGALRQAQDRADALPTETENSGGDMKAAQEE